MLTLEKIASEYFETNIPLQKTPREEAKFQALLSAKSLFHKTQQRWLRIRKALPVPKALRI